MSQDPLMNVKYFRRQSVLWLIAAAVVAVVWLLVWLTTSAPSIITKQKPEDQIQGQSALPERIEKFSELDQVVKPLDFSALIRDMRTYPAEFKDKIFFENFGKQYTVELLDITDNQVIVDYLNSRDDRKKFAYFRYLDHDKKPRYILTYGKFKTESEAQDAMRSVQFDLPQTIKPKTVLASDYLSIIENYMRAETIHDPSSRQRGIRLQPTSVEIPVQAATELDKKRFKEELQQSDAQFPQLQETAPTPQTPAVKEEIKRTIVTSDEHKPDVEMPKSDGSHRSESDLADGGPKEPSDLESQ